MDSATKMDQKFWSDNVMKLFSFTLVFLSIIPIWASADQNLCKLSYEKKQYQLALRECQQIMQSDPYALYVLAEINFELSSELSPKAIKQFMKAADQGVIKAQRRLGELSEHGAFGRKNYKQARYWYQMAAEQSDPASQFSLGNFMLMGRGGEKDSLGGLMWLQLAAKQGNLDAMKIHNEIKKKFTSEELRKVQKSVEDWLSSHPKINHSN